MTDYRAEYMDALRRIAELEREVAATKSLMLEARESISTARTGVEQADAMRRTESDALRRDLSEAQQKLMNLTTSGLTEQGMQALNAELAAYKANNTVFVEALQACADCSKSQAQQIAAAALGQPTD